MDLPEVRQPEAATGKGGGATRRQLSLLDSLREHLSFSLDVELLQNPFIIFFFQADSEAASCKSSGPATICSWRYELFASCYLTYFILCPDLGQRIFRSLVRPRRTPANQTRPGKITILKVSMKTDSPRKGLDRHNQTKKAQLPRTSYSIRLFSLSESKLNKVGVSKNDCDSSRVTWWFFGVALVREING